MAQQCCPDHSEYCRLCRPPGKSHPASKCLWRNHRVEEVDREHLRDACPDCKTQHPILSSRGYVWDVTGPRPLVSYVPPKRR